MEPVFEILEPASVGEPRVALIKMLIESMQALVELECQGKVVHADAFRFKSLGDWSFPLPVDFNDIIGSPSPNCNMSCEFCFEKGNPPGGVLPSQINRHMLTSSENLTV